ncbi:MAG: hypothetical protein V2J10_01855 [Wenzhouxiangella sp.]|jgi:hypothetical protein|nr:hypothetical protein [Wenzhouxiangella sp.]
MSRTADPDFTKTGKGAPKPCALDASRKQDEATRQLIIEVDPTAEVY